RRSPGRLKSRWPSDRRRSPDGRHHSSSEVIVESPEDDAETLPATADQVARRALALAAVSCRGILEAGPAREHAERFWGRVADWWSGLGLKDELELDEASLLETPFGASSPQALANASWRSEALCVLAWALRRAELPAHDEPVDPAATARTIGFLEDRTV